MTQLWLRTPTKSSTIALVLMLAALGAMTVGLSVGTAQDVELRNYTLQVVSPFPKLPVGGDTYPLYILLRDPNGSIVEFPHDMKISVKVDNSEVLEPLTTIINARSGSFYAEVLVRTKNVGITSLVVEAVNLAGVGSGFIAIEVVEPAGKPYRLSAYLLPNNLLPSDDGLILTWVEDFYGGVVPFDGREEFISSVVPRDLAVIGGLLEVEGNRFYRYLRLKPNNVTGVGRLFLAERDLSLTDPLEFSVGRRKPSLSVYLLPDNMVADGKSRILILVQILDDEGRPLITKEPVTVYLSSSNTSVIQVLTSRVVIEAGSDHGLGEAILGSKSGNAIIIASAEGFLPGEAQFTSTVIEELDEEGGPVMLRLFTTQTLAEGVSYPLVVAQTTASGFVYPPLVGFNVTIVSDDANVARVANLNTTLYLGRPYGINRVIGVGSGGEESTAILVASPISINVGLVSATLELTVFKPGFLGGGRPIRLELRGPEAIPSGEMVPYSVVLLDENDSPVPADRDMVVRVTSRSFGDVRIDINSTRVVIPRGRSHAYLWLRAYGSGEFELAAIASGLEPSTLTVSAFNPFPTSSFRIGVSMIPPVIRAGVSQPVLVFIYIVDLNNNPYLPIEPVNVSINFVPEGPLDEEYTVIRRGSFYSLIRMLPLDESVTTQVIAVYKDLLSKASVRFVELPLDIRVVDGIDSYKPGSEYTFTLRLLSRGVPVPDVSVRVSSRFGRVEPAISLTDSDGVVRFRYVAPNAPSDSITIVAGKVGFTSLVKSLELVALKPREVRLSILALSSTLKKPLAGVGFQIYSIDGDLVSSGRTSEEGGAEVLLPEGAYKVVFQDEMMPSDDIRIVLERVDGLGPDMSLNLVNETSLGVYYRVYYRVEAKSPYGEVSGVGEYPEGSIVVIRVDPTVTSEFPVRHVFKEWVGTYTSKTPNITLTVDRPINLVAVWVEDYTLVYITVPVGLLIVIIGVLTVFARRRARRAALREEEELYEE